MMGGKCRFESVPALRKLEPQVLRDLLACFPEHAKARGIELPGVATEENLDYTAIRNALMEGKIPDELDDILHLATRLGDVKGWECIERQAREDGRSLQKPCPRHGHVDLAIVAEIEDWPKHQGFLERANARARVHSKSAYVYYAPAGDWRGLFRPPTADGVEETRVQLTSHLIAQGVLEDEDHGRGVEVIPYNFEKEVWFLIRYPGRQKRQSGCDRHGDWKSYVFNPEQYDAVAYSKEFGDIRMNTRRVRDHAKYRILFGSLLFGDVANAFKPREHIVSLVPVEGDRAVELFGCDDVPGLSRVDPVILSFDVGAVPTVKHTLEASVGGSLLDNNQHAPRLLPPESWGVRQLTVQYRRKGKEKEGRITLTAGNKITYERDGDSVVVEDWLRKRGFVKSFVGR